MSFTKYRYHSKIILFLCWVYAYPTLFAQNMMEGKIYRATLSSYCKKSPGGGCMGYRYCLLTFGKSHVKVSYYTQEDCTKDGEMSSRIKSQEQEQEYTYEWSYNTLSIKGWKEYQTFEIKDNILIASNKQEHIEFIVHEK